MRILTATLITFTVLFLASCEENTTNYYTNPPAKTSIEGTINPADSGIAIAAAEETYQTKISATGYYHFPDVKPGIYDISIIPANHNRRLLRKIEVQSEERNIMPLIQLLDSPYPILGSSPSPGASNVSLKQSIGIFCDDFLNFESFLSGVRIEPALEGQWHQAEIDYPYVGIQNDITYSFSRTTPDGDWFKFGTTYTVYVDSTVLLESGARLGKSWEFEFTVIPMEYVVDVSSSGIDGNASIWQFSARVSFTDCVLIDSFERLAKFSPEINGVWIPDKGSCYG